MTQVLIDESLQTVVVEETATTVIVRAPGPAPAGAGAGTVTSIDASGGTTGLTFSGGPITGAGTLTLAGTLAVASGGTGATSASGARASLSAAASGANSDITSMTGVTGGIASPDFITFDTGATTSAAVGRLRWDSANGTARLGMVGGNVESQLGQTIDALVHNAEATSLSKGEVVYLFSATGDRASVKRAINTSDATSAKTIGVVAETIAAGQNGLIRCQGVLEGLNLGAFTAGDTLYLGATAGTTTATKPVAPNHLVYVGVVERANAGNGFLYVRIQNGYELGELHDVLITSAAAGAVLSYDATAGLWKDATIASGAGITVTNADSSVTVATSGAVTSSGFTMTTARLLGRTTASTGAIEQITVGSGLSLSGGTLTATGGGSGTVTSVDVSGGTTGLTTSGGPVTGAGTITISGTLNVGNGGTGATTLTGIVKGNGTSAFSAAVAGTDFLAPFGSQSQAFVYAAPSGSAGTPSFRALVASDIPTLNQNTTGTSANVTGTVAVANGGTGATDAATARSNLTAQKTITSGTAAPSGGSDGDIYLQYT